MRIKSSKRGLTFSFKEREGFKAGEHYRYFVDIQSKEVVIVPDLEGKYVFSKKGAEGKPLVDLRNQEIREAISMASFMEVEMCDDKIIVHLVSKAVNTENLSDVELVQMLDKEDSQTLILDKQSFLEHDSDLITMLTASGFFSAEQAGDLSYVFDVCSLFSGAGLLDLPFASDPSFAINFATDWSEDACKTYRNNIGDHILCCDIRELDADVIPDADVVLGGVCCQGYSNANRAGNFYQDASKRLLVDDFNRVVQAKKPLMFVIENVPQFITKENSKYLNKVFESLGDSYHITYSVVDDYELGGYSTRKRMVLIGSIKDMGPVVIPDVALTTKHPCKDALSKVDSSWPNYADITAARPDTVQKMAQVRPGHNYKDINGMAQLDRHSNVYRRLSGDEPSVTITNWRKVNLMPPVGNRILSVSEAAAIMGLDKNFKFYGSLDSRQQQVGNGVTQAIARFVKSIVKNALYKYVNEKTGLALA